MKLIETKRDETGKEKHLPVIEKSDGKIVVKVGSVQHPMEENHYIELITNDTIYRKHLSPGEEPKAEKVIVRA